MTSTVISKDASPDGKYKALLVGRFYNSARTRDVFFLIVAPSDNNVDDVINAREFDNSSAFIATDAKKVYVRWKSANELMVLCDRCNLSRFSIEKKEDHTKV